MIHECEYFFNNFISSVCVDIINGSALKISKNDNEHFLMCINIAIYLGKNIFGINKLILESFIGESGIDEYPHYEEDYDELLLIYIDKLHKYGTKGISHYLKLMIEYQSYNNEIIINWKNVMKNLVHVYGIDNLRSALIKLGKASRHFYYVDNKNKSVAKFSYLTDSVFQNMYQGKINDDFSKYLKNFGINEENANDIERFFYEFKFMEEVEFFNGFWRIF